VDRASPARFPRVRHDVVQSNTNHITVCVIFYLVCLYGFTSNTYYAFDSTYTSCIAFYVTQRLFGATWYLAVGIILRQVRGAMIMTSITTLITAAIWIASIHVPWPGQLAPIVIAILLDLFGNVFLIWTMKAAAKRKLPEAFASWFEFFPAINIEHRVERNNAFVSLVGQYTADFSSHMLTFSSSGLWILYPHDPVPVEILFWHQRILWQGNSRTHPSFHVQLVYAPEEF
jgi:hypothetical protein